MAHYTKTYSSPAQLVTLLQSRGLHVENVARTENYLCHIGYYRFSAYLYPLLTTPKENHVFKLYLMASDIFKTWRERWTMYGQGVESSKDCYNYTRSISLQITYNFNAKRSKYRGTGAGNEEKNRL